MSNTVTESTPHAQLATFAAGCFWGVEADFREVPGVLEAVVGTGHAEVVQVTFDPARVSYEQLLDAFWSIHDPTTRNRQGPDVGTQYRSAIFYHSDEQRAQAEASKAREDASGRHRGRIVTEIVPATSFYLAEEYHQRYLEKQHR